MAAAAEREKTVKVRLKASLANPYGALERGQEVEVALADARRLIVRGLAEEIKGEELPRANAAEDAAARVVYVQTQRTPDGRLRQKGNRCRYEPAAPPAGGDTPEIEAV